MENSSCHFSYAIKIPLKLPWRLTNKKPFLEPHDLTTILTSDTYRRNKSTAQIRAKIHPARLEFGLLDVAIELGKAIGMDVIELERERETQ